MLTVGDLREALKMLPVGVWIVGDSGPVTHLHIEMGANEPFIVLHQERVSWLQNAPRCDRCQHWQPEDETCEQIDAFGADVKALITTPEDPSAVCLHTAADFGCVLWEAISEQAP